MSKPRENLNLFNLVEPDHNEINENDVNLIEKGMFLNKLNTKKQKFDEVFYKLDLVNHQLIASKNQSGNNQKFCKNFKFIRIIND